MKKVVLMLAVSGLMLATPSCKKGENDPFLSLSSRKARVAGSWEVTGWESTLVQTQADGDQGTTTESMSGDVITTSTTWTSGGTSTTSTSTTTVNEGTFTFEKDGTWSRVWNTTTVDVSTMDWGGVTFTTTSTTVETHSSSGDWSFVGKVKDNFKNKERIVMNTLTATNSSQTTSVTTNSFDSSTNTTNGDLDSWTNNYTSGEQQMMFEIDQLKGKEMIWMMHWDNSGTNSTTPFGGSTTTTTDDTWVGSQTITLTAI